jgi:predicted DNA-binding transcriptional regulator AlpA
MAITPQQLKERELDHLHCDEIAVEWLNLDDLAAVLQVSKHTLYKWSRRGLPDFPKHRRLPNRQIRLSECDFESWMSDGLQ